MKTKQREWGLLQKQRNQKYQKFRENAKYVLKKKTSNLQMSRH